jgi:hypothetical protein
MKVKTQMFALSSVSGHGWCRLFGVGFTWKDTRRVPLIFSERHGHKKRLRLGPWSFALLARDNAN